MILTDSVSSIMQATPSDYLVHFEDIPINPDPDYFFDLKTHLQTVESYRKERKAFYKLHPGWSLYRCKDEFAKEYTDLFHKDIDWFVRSKPHMTAGEAAQEFCMKYKGYLLVYGIEWTERAIKRLSK